MIRKLETFLSRALPRGALLPAALLPAALLPAALLLATAPLAVGCSAGDAPAARTEALETVGGGSDPAAEEVLEPAHAQLPGWVPAALHASVGASRLPVMLPEDPELLAHAQVLSQDRWVSARIETPTFIAVIFGTDAHHEPPRGASFRVPDRDRTIRGEPGYAYENEGLYYAQWNEGDIAWDVELDCLGVACAGVERATDLAESLQLVGGVR